MTNKLTLLLCIALLLVTHSFAQTDTTSRNAGVPNYGRTIILADSVARARITDSAGVTLNTAQSIPSIKTFSGGRTSGTGQVFIGSTGRAGMLSFYNYSGNAFGAIGYNSGSTDTALVIASSGGSGNISFYTAGQRRGYIHSGGYLVWDSAIQANGKMLYLNAPAGTANDSLLVVNSNGTIGKVAPARLGLGTGGSSDVTLNTDQTIASVKTFAPAITGNGAAVVINPTFTATANSNQLYGLDIADPTVINNGGYTNISSMSARFRGSVLVGGTIDAKYLRSNDFQRGSDASFNVSKSSANLLNGLVFRATSAATATSSMVNGTLFIDTVYFNANTTASGYSQVRLTPALTQTGYSGITRGLYVSPLLTNVTNFRGVETNVAYAEGYQLYAGGTGRNYFKGRTSVDSIWVFNDATYFNAQSFYNNIRSNAYSYYTLTSMQLQKPANPTSLTTTADVFKIFSYGKNTIANSNWNGVGIYDSLQITQNITSGRISALRVSPVVLQTGYTGPIRGLLIDPVLTNTTDFRAIETNIVDGAGYQLYAAGTASSYFAGKVGIGTTQPQSELAVNGTITTKRVKVTTTGWADYVFDSSYQLTPLAQVEAYVKQNKHLPEVPTAAIVTKEGVDVGDNQVLLLKKIEELTLYIIEQNKKLEAQGKQLEAQGAAISLLKQKLK